MNTQMQKRAPYIHDCTLQDMLKLEALAEVQHNAACTTGTTHVTIRVRRPSYTPKATDEQTFGDSCNASPIRLTRRHSSVHLGSLTISLPLVISVFDPVCICQGTSDALKPQSAAHTIIHGLTEDAVAARRPVPRVSIRQPNTLGITNFVNLNPADRCCV